MFAWVAFLFRLQHWVNITVPRDNWRVMHQMRAEVIGSRRHALRSEDTRSPMRDNKLEFVVTGV